MGRGFETGSDNERIDELQKQLDDINDSQINSVGGNENISIDSTRGQRNDASGDAGGVRSNEPIIHNITDVDEDDISTGVFDKINIISSMAIIDHTSTPITLRFIQGTVKDGARIKITPKIGKTIDIESGGNILTSTTITITDTDFYELVKYSEAETGVTGGAFKIFLTGAGGGGDVIGPGSSTDNAIARFDGLTGKIIQNSTVIISDLGAITEVAGIDMFANLVANPITNASFISFISDLAATRGQFGRSDFFAGTDDGLVLNVPALQHFSITKDVVEKIIYDAADDQLRFTDTDIIAAGATRGLFNIGHLDFVDNTATPAATFSIYSDGTDLLANTGSHVTNFDNLPELTITNIFTAINTFNENIIAGGAGDGMSNIGHLDFIDNLATPVAALSIFSDGADMLVNTGGGTVNLTNIGSGVFLDSTFRVIGSGDQTKQLAFEVDTFTTGMTRTFGWPDANGEVLVTPAQVDIDLNTFDIFDIDKLAFMNFASTGSSLNIGFSALGSGGFRANVLNNGDFEITEENILHFSFDGGLNSINVIDSLFNILETVGSTAYQISKSNGETILNEPTKIQQQIAGTDIFDIQSGGITMADDKFIANVDQIGFRILGNFIEDDVSGMRYISVPGDQHLFGDGTNIFATLDVEGLFLNQLFIQFTSIASPGVTGSPNVGELFMDSGNSDHLSIIRNASVIDLEAGGGAAALDGVQEFEIPTTDLDIDGDVQEIFITNGKQGYEVSKSTTIQDDIVTYLPVYIAQRSRVTDLGWTNLETGAGTITFAMGLYDNIGGGVNYPGDLIVQDTSSTVTGLVQAARTNSLTPTNIEAGLYWIALLPTNMQIGILASCSRHDTAGANSAGYFDDEGNTDVFLSILAFTTGETSLPSTADLGMAAVVENPPAVFMRLIPNTS